MPGSTFIPSLAILICAIRVLIFTAIPKLAHAHVEQTLDVTSFGAKGDGISDDTDAIASASREVSVKGGTLVFPKGTFIFNPARAKILVGSVTTIRGPGTIKVKPGSGKYEYIIGAPDPISPLSTIVLDGLTVDQNVEENQVAIVNSDLSTIQAVFLSWNIGALLVRNCRFEVSGVNTLIANPSHGSGVFENNIFVFHRRPDQHPFDNSAIYFVGPKATAIGNECRAQLDSHAVTCLEMHGGDVNIAENRAENYEILTNVVNVKSATISNNHARGAQFGIFLWATVGNSCRNVSITGNDLAISNVDRAASGSGGIATYYGQGITGAFDGISIVNNHVTFQPETHPRAIDYPRSNWGISTQAFGPVKNVKIVNNTIENAPVRGIKIGQIKLDRQEPLQSDIVVEGNLIVNPGYDSDVSLAPYRAAIAVEGRVDNAVIRDNTIRASDTAKGIYTIWFAEGASSYRNVKCYGQRLLLRVESREAVPHEVLRGP